MKKIFAVLLVFLMVFSLCACGAGNKKSDKVLSIGTSPDFPPFEYLEDGKVVGIEIDILNLICEKLDMTLEINQMDFDSVLPGVSAGKFKLGVSGITVNEDRKKNALFTDPYCMAAQAIVVMEGSPITCKADLEGKTVSAQTGTTAETFCMSEGYKVQAFTANSDAQNALVAGKVDAWVIDDLTAAEMVKVYNETASVKLVVLDEPMTLEPYAFAAAKGNEKLISSINDALNSLVADGTVAKIFEKYDAVFISPEK